MPMHPTVSTCGTETYNTAKFITRILHNYCGNTTAFVKDRTNFIWKIKHLSINPEEEALVSFDVSVLFASHTGTCCTTSYQFQNFYLHQVVHQSRLKKELVSFENVSKKQFVDDAKWIIYNFLY